MTARVLGTASEVATDEEAPAQGMVASASASQARRSAASIRGAPETHPVPLPAPTEGQTEERANKWVVLALASVAAFMTTLDGSIVNISLPSIAHAFGVAATGAVEWVIIGYLIVTAASLLTFGRLADMFGRKPLFLVGLVIFTLGSALCGAAPSLAALIVARGVQGLGAALIFAVNVAMITRVFPAAERGRALGTNALLLAMGISVGPTFGGLITQHLTWRWIFYVNVPIGLLVLLAAIVTLTERPHWKRQRFDPAGAALLAVAVTALTLGLSFGQEWGWSSWRLIVTLAVLVPIERHAPAPILDLRLLRTRVFALANVSYTLCTLALTAVSYLLPFYFEQLRGFDAQQSGLLLTPLAVALAVVGPISGILADRAGSRLLAPMGLAIACLGLLLLSQLNATSSIGVIIGCLVVTGVGQGLFQCPSLRAIMGAAPRQKQGAASGILATGRVVGQSLSVALAGAVFAASGGAAAGNLLVTRGHTLSAAQVGTLQHAFVGGLHAAFVVCAAVAAIGVVTTLARGPEKTAAPSERVDVVRQAQAIPAVHVGHPSTQAAHAAGFQSGDSVRWLVERFNWRGLASLTLATGRGRQAPCTAAQRERIVQELQRAPDHHADSTATWSLKMLERALGRGALPQVSVSTIRVVLHETGYRFGRPRTWCPTGTAVRQRHGRPVTIPDPRAEGNSARLNRPIGRRKLAAWRCGARKRLSAERGPKSYPGNPPKRSHHCRGQWRVPAQARRPLPARRR
jgi:EmrB/QacA subfamily drug resistance transporter